MGVAATPMLIGSAIGAMSSKNPLQGALIGGALGGAGGAFLQGSGGLSSLMPSLGSSTAASTVAPAVTNAVANSPVISGFTGQAVSPVMSTIFSNPTSAIGGTALGGGPSTGLIPSSMAPSFMEDIGSGFKSLGQFAEQNPSLQRTAMQSAQQALQQQDPRFVPPGQVNRGQIQGGDYMSILNPQQSPVLRPQPISLLG